MLEEERKRIIDLVTGISPDTFDFVLEEVWKYQYQNNPLYRSFTKQINMAGENRNKICFLPISAFKQHDIKAGDWAYESIFESSGTTGSIPSRHYVRDTSWYLESCVKGWESVYGNVSEYSFLCLLPGYLERKGSSLVKMMDHFVKLSNFSSGFYLNNHRELYQQLLENKSKQIPTVLLGVSFGLLDFVEKYTLKMPNLIVVETGGMKGRREEMTKEELHALLKSSFNTTTIHSEYGMTELFSQAYSKADGLFQPTPTLKIVITEITDPLSPEKLGKTGVVNVIDLSNIDSCSFIQTQDLGILYEDGSFRIMGRLDEADIRGCNLMVL